MTVPPSQEAAGGAAATPPEGRAPLWIAAAAVFDAEGLVSSRGLCRPELRPERPPSWRALFDSPCAGYRRLPLRAKLLLTVAEAAGLALVPEPDEAALVLASTWGSLETDLAFAESLRTDRDLRPALFPYTLPSTCLGEVAIRFRLRGPTLCLSVPPGAEGAALEEGAAFVWGGEAPLALAAVADAVGAGGARAGARSPGARAALAVLAPEPGGLCPLEDLLAAADPWRRLGDRLRSSA
ncbi:MAG: hypothetical protein D6731_17510 [Planctomycetota bacterium]|nr:MAG: hypothetical protein D6731_17510 [Planctomycetota bacterium]